nr:hypothetical protein [Tanacetum cinerariifolium]
SEDDGNGEEDQGLKISEEERLHEEEEADKLYRDVDINQGRGLQVSQDIDDSRVTLTLVHSDGQQESSSTSSFVTSLLNPIVDPGMESIFTTGSSSVTPIPSPKSTMTPSIITTTTTTSQPPIPSTPIPSDILQTLPTFASVFHFEDRVKPLEVNFSEFMRTNQSPEAVSNILDSLQRENDEFLRTIDDNMKKIIKEQVKSQVKAYVTRILPRIKESVNAQLEIEVLTRSSHSSRTSYNVAADLSEMELKKILIDKMEGNKSIQEDVTMMMIRKDPSLDQTGGLRDEEKPRKPPTTDRDWNKTLPAAQGSAQLWISELEKQFDVRSSFNELLDTPIDFSNFIMNRLGGRKCHQFYRFAVNRESALNVYSKRRIIAVTDLKIVEWHNYKHLDWISVRRDDDKIYKFKEGDFKRLRLQDIEDMLLLLVQGKLSNLTVEEPFAFNVSLRIDGTLNDVRNALDDHLKGIRMQYLPTTIWRKGDKDRAVAMIQAIDKMLKTRRIMRSLERFVGRRQYEGDFRMLQRTI